jgi:toxin ParE1/3/4
MKLIITDIANKEIETGILYYKKTASLNIANSFGEQIKECVNFVKENPEASRVKYFARKYKISIRSAKIRGFPYGIFYVLDKEEIKIVRFLHLHRDLVSMFV